MKQRPLSPILFALAAAGLFGASTPLAKLLVGRVDPIMLAGLMYFGSGLCLIIWKSFGLLTQRTEVSEVLIERKDLLSLGGAILFGGMLGPFLLMLGLSSTPASSASLLLNLEGVLTALLAWFVFRENFDRRIALGMVAITAGGIILSWEGTPDTGLPWGVFAIAGACFAWAIDNNLTRNVSAADPVTIAALKGIVAGSVNLIIAFSLGVALPPLQVLYACLAVGLFGYGISLTLYVLALRHLGTARTGAYFSIAPFIGAMISIVFLGDRPTAGFFIAAVFMGLGVWLHLTERHEHKHTHEELTHDHDHIHHEHHQHDHGPDDPPGEPHRHVHRHRPLVHSHPHFPDIHHRHDH
ncbi:DMT family transporter [soil metagenome]